MSTKPRDRGFSFIELLAYMAIAALLILAAIPQFNQHRQKALLTNLQNDVHNASLAAEASNDPASIRAAVAAVKRSSPDTQLTVAEVGSGEYTITGTHPRSPRTVIYSSASFNDGTRTLRPGLNLIKEADASAAIMRSTWRTSGGDCMTLALPLGGSVIGTINWGDGQTTTATANATHTYFDGKAQHEITIEGTFGSFGTARSATATCLQAVSEWGETKTTDISYAFAGTSQLTTLPTRIPSTVTNLRGIFQQSTYNGSAISGWDVSKVTDLSLAFNASAYNNPLNWDTSNVVTMEQTFSGTAAFNQPLNHWNVAKVSNFSGMFWSARAFNQPLNQWNTGAATNMSNTFRSNNTFAQDVSGWNVARVTNSSLFAFDSTLPTAKQPRFAA